MLNFNRIGLLFLLPVQITSLARKLATMLVKPTPAPNSKTTLSLNKSGWDKI